MQQEPINILDMLDDIDFEKPVVISNHSNHSNHSAALEELKRFINARVVFTGELSSMTREYAKSVGAQYLKMIPADQVTGNVKFLVAGEKAGSKLAKAKKLGIEIIDESTFIKYLTLAGYAPF